MKSAQPVVQSGSFVASGTGARLRIVSEPADRVLRGTVIFVHAFAEEMNKSRRMAARMARLLAGEGWRVVQRDLCGCGDSSGEFADATWSAWLADVDDELSRCAPGPAVWLWCQRAGALLAPGALNKRAEVNLLLWQPVASGAQHLQQFLRLHAGARIVGSSKTDGGPSPMQRLRAGETIEVGGYAMSSALALGMEQAVFDLAVDFRGRVIWLEVSPDVASELPPAAARVTQRLRERGLAVDAQVVQGPPFWQTQEIEDCDALLEQTLQLMRDGAQPVAQQAPHSVAGPTTTHGAAT
jgi:exosortase A-associated hydrolase 2